MINNRLGSTTDTDADGGGGGGGGIVGGDKTIVGLTQRSAGGLVSAAVAGCDRLLIVR